MHGVGGMTPNILTECGLKRPNLERIYAAILHEKVCRCLFARTASALELESNLSDRMGGPGLPNIPTASAFKNTSRTDVIGTLGTETFHFTCAVIYIFAHELWVSKLALSLPDDILQNESSLP
jgi:hypothetical protein